MKVCTDSCIFGAWLAKQNLQVIECLEIGAGTGLLSLMYAQKNKDCKIDALEVEKNACTQADENFKNSDWGNRLNLICTDAKTFLSDKKYDLVFSNPPFFDNDLLSLEKNKNLAKHNEGLTLEDIFNIIEKHISPTGYCCILLPPARARYFHQLATEKSFFLQKRLIIKHNKAKKTFREILLFRRSETILIEEEFIIKDDNGDYSNDFKHLLKDYYLQL